MYILLSVLTAFVKNVSYYQKTKQFTLVFSYTKESELVRAHSNVNVVFTTHDQIQQFLLFFFITYTSLIKPTIVYGVLIDNRMINLFIVNVMTIICIY